jgi:hypothetical protein
MIISLPLLCVGPASSSILVLVLLFCFIIVIIYRSVKVPVQKYELIFIGTIQYFPNHLSVQISGITKYGMNHNMKYEHKIRINLQVNTQKYRMTFLACLTHFVRRCHWEGEKRPKLTDEKWHFMMTD